MLYKINVFKIRKVTSISCYKQLILKISNLFKTMYDCSWKQNSVEFLYITSISLYKERIFLSQDTCFKKY